MQKTILHTSQQPGFVAKSERVPDWSACGNKKEDKLNWGTDGILP